MRKTLSGASPGQGNTHRIQSCVTAASWILDECAAPNTIIHIHHVVLPPAMGDHPKIILYVFIADDIARAVTYGWADPSAVVIGMD